jgi:hypothetical protein
MTSLWSVWAPASGHPGGYAIYCDFGPFDVSPCRCKFGVEGELEGLGGDLANEGCVVEKGLRGDGGTPGDYQVTLRCT